MNDKSFIRLDHEHDVTWIRFLDSMRESAPKNISVIMWNKYVSTQLAKFQGRLVPAHAFQQLSVYELQYAQYVEFPDHESLLTFQLAWS